MKKYILIVLSVILIFFGQTTFAKEYTVHKLSNGQTLIIKENHDNPIVTIDTWIKTGSINEDNDNNGVAHFLEHMFFKGTVKYPAGKFDQILESKGAITNAATSKDYTHYYIVLPSKDFNLAMDMHADMLLNPVLPRNELEMERKVVLDEMARGNDDLDRVLYKNMISLMYKEHPYKRDVIGTTKVLETISREKMFEFYNTWYQPNNMITVVVGDVDGNEVIKSVEKNFAVVETKKLPKKEYKMDHVYIRQHPIVKNFDTEMGYLLFGFRGVKAEDIKTSATLDVLATILGDGKSSRLYQQIQEKKHLASSIYAGHSSYKDDSIFFVKSTFEPKQQENLEKNIWLEIEKIKMNNVSKDELQKAKNIIKNEIAYARESNSNIANELGYTTLLLDNPKYYNLYLKEIEKVSIKDVKMAANKYLDKNKAAISYIMPMGNNIKPIKKLNFKSNEINEPVVNDNVIKTQKEYNLNGQAKLISEYKNTKKYLLDNGLTLIITKNTSNNIVAMNLISKGGYFQENKRGTGLLLADLMAQGTKNYSAQELNNILEEKGIYFSSNIGSDAFYTSLKMTKDELKNGLNLFDEIINNANLDEKELIKIKDKKLQNMKISKDLPSTLAFDEIKYLLWADTPYQSSMKVLETAIPDVTQKDIKELYSKIYTPENTIVSINGDVNDSEIIGYFEEVFKDKKSEKFNYKNYEKKVYAISQNRISNIEKNSNQSWIILGYRTPQITSKTDWATLKVMDTILGSGMSSRLFTRLRDQQGLAYSVGSTYQTNILGGAFAFYMGTKSENIDIAKEKMAEQVDIIKRSFVSSSELEKAKEQILGNYLISQETNSEKAHTMGHFELVGKGYDFEKDYAKYINEVTEQDIIEMANRVFSTPVVTVIVK